uniref:Uncharacterized protein n=1 Tax=Anguilla anguilla TaxID=7936 RepID=A0A0E9QBI0_ANGAN
MSLIRKDPHFSTPFW